MPLPKEKAWFSSKRYGYGWGLPSRWQGWVVFIAYIGAFIIGMRLIPKGAGYFFRLCFWHYDSDARDLLVEGRTGTLALE